MFPPNEEETVPSSARVAGTRPQASRRDSHRFRCSPYFRLPRRKFKVGFGLGFGEDQMSGEVRTSFGDKVLEEGGLAFGYKRFGLVQLDLALTQFLFQFEDDPRFVFRAGRLGHEPGRFGFEELTFITELCRRTNQC